MICTEHSLECLCVFDVLTYVHGNCRLSNFIVCILIENKMECIWGYEPTNSTLDTYDKISAAGSHAIHWCCPEPHIDIHLSKVCICSSVHAQMRVSKELRNLSIIHVVLLEILSNRRYLPMYIGIKQIVAIAIQICFACESFSFFDDPVAKIYKNHTFGNAKLNFNRIENFKHTHT